MSSALKAHIVIWTVLIVSSSVFSQEKDPVDQRWKQMHDRIEYFPSNSPEGPENRYNYPPNMREGGQPAPSGNFSPGKPSDDDIVYSREKRYSGGSGSGVKKRIKEGDEDDLDDLSKPDTDAPDIDAPDWDGPNIERGDGTFWKVLFIIIGVILLAFIIYQLFFKGGSKKKDEGVAPANYDDEELDPSTIQRSQLEIDLDEAIANEDYRLAVRIMYTMILKALVEKRWIIWEKKKTNYHYLLEMNKRNERSDFDKSIRIFEWVWYGKNIPSSSEFKTVDSFYKKFLKQLQGE
tara:strand:- start:106893 stop:107768 length:876 start_codon:yes stop_codon:yes gene_type:complete